MVPRGNGRRKAGGLRALGSRTYSVLVEYRLPANGAKMARNKERLRTLFEAISRVVFTLTAGILMLLALVLAIDALVRFFSALWGGRDIGLSALIGIGYVVVAIAVFDVAKYLIEEEVMREREMRVASEARRSLTRFISTIAIAVFLEALVMVFRVSQDRISDLVFPTLLLFAGMALVLTLGVYQRLSATVEIDVEHRDKAKEKELEK
jgi:hypothetical protein